MHIYYFCHNKRIILQIKIGYKVLKKGQLSISLLYFLLLLGYLLDPSWGYFWSSMCLLRSAICLSSHIIIFYYLILNSYFCLLKSCYYCFTMKKKNCKEVPSVLDLGWSFSFCSPLPAFCRLSVSPVVCCGKSDMGV